MENQTPTVTPKQQNPVVALMQRDSVKQRFQEILGGKSAAFLSSVLATVNSNENLKKATPESVYMAAMMAAVVNLPINPNLGFAYVIPYGDKAQFQMGYKGFIQLAQRSGQYRTISAAPVYEGQLKSTDPLKGYVFDWEGKKSDKLIGYAGYFELINGFQKSLFMTVDELNRHGAKYSKTYSSNSSKWKTDFESMAMKTVIKLLISKFGPLSVDTQMQKAIVADQAIIKDAETMDVEYTDAPAEQLPEANLEATKSVEEANRFREAIAASSTKAELDKIETKVRKMESESIRNEILLEIADKRDVVK